MISTEISETLSRDIDTISLPEIHDNLTGFKNLNNVIEFSEYEIEKIPDYILSQESSLEFISYLSSSISSNSK